MSALFNLKGVNNYDNQIEVEGGRQLLLNLSVCQYFQVRKPSGLTVMSHLSFLTITRPTFKFKKKKIVQMEDSLQLHLHTNHQRLHPTTDVLLVNPVCNAATANVLPLCFCNGCMYRTSTIWFVRLLNGLGGSNKLNKNVSKFYNHKERKDTYSFNNDEQDFLD